jgi:hypothetical protein
MLTRSLYGTSIIAVIQSEVFDQMSFLQHASDWQQLQVSNATPSVSSSGYEAWWPERACGGVLSCSDHLSLHTLSGLSTLSALFTHALSTTCAPFYCSQIHTLQSYRGMVWLRCSNNANLLTHTA